MHCALIIILSACTDNANQDTPTLKEDLPTEVSFTLSSRSTTIQSRADADGTPADPDNDKEIINDWFLVFADRSNTIQKVITRTQAGIETLNNPVEAETFRFVLPSGHYNVYAFANISTDDLQTATGLSFTVGDKISLTDIDEEIWESELNNRDITKPIPMTGFLRNIEVKNTIEENFSIEVVRMVAKVEFQFKNPTDSIITVTEVSFDPVTTSPVSLFPRNSNGIGYTHLGYESYAPLQGATYAPLNITAENFTVSKSGGVESLKFYMKETVSNRDNDEAFTVGIKVRHGNGTAETQQYNITKDIHTYINRNDWIKIPITLSQYDVEVEAIFYPPIGGYPAVLSTTDPDGSQIFTFGTEGEFAIVPKVIDKLAGSHLAPSKYSIEVGDISGDNIFTSNGSPKKEETAISLPDEIKGTLSGTKGKAKVEIKVKIGTQTYARTLYILQE